MPAFVLAGSNLPDRLAHLAQGINGMLRLPATLLRMSAVYETEPWGGAPQPWYLNVALCLQTTLSPQALLQELLRLEAAAGRTRTGRSAPRTLDLDLVLYDNVVVQSPELTLPHPRMHLRRFTLLPLAEIAPQWIHPVLQQTIDQLLESCPDPLAVYRTDFTLSLHAPPY